MKKLSPLRLCLGALIATGAIAAACSQRKYEDTTPQPVTYARAPLETAQAEGFARDAGVPRGDGGVGGTARDAGVAARDAGGPRTGGGDAGVGRQSGDLSPPTAPGAPIHPGAPQTPTAPTQPGTPPPGGIPPTPPQPQPQPPPVTPTPTPR